MATAVRHDAAMRQLLRDNLGLCASTAAIVLAASRIFAFAGHDVETALVVVRYAGALNVGLASLLSLLSSLVGAALLYGAVYMVRRPALRARTVPQLAAGLVLGYGVLAVPWPVLMFYAVIVVVTGWPSSPGDSSDTRGTRAAAVIRRRVAVPAIGFAAAGMLVGGGGNVLPSERVESTRARPPSDTCLKSRRMRCCCCERRIVRRCA